MATLLREAALRYEVQAGTWQLATGDGENLTARVERFEWTQVLVLAVVVASCHVPVASCQVSRRETPMKYDEDLLVELIAAGDVSQTQIAKRVGISRHTVWRIANGRSRPDLQRRIAATIEGYRRETIRLAGRFMKRIVKKQIDVALESDGETARKCREFLIKTFMFDTPPPAALPPDEPDDAPKQLDSGVLFNSLAGLSPELKKQVVKELCAAEDERLSTTENTESTEVVTTTANGDSTTACPERSRRDGTLLRQGFGGQADNTDVVTANDNGGLTTENTESTEVVTATANGDSTTDGEQGAKATDVEETKDASSPLSPALRSSQSEAGSPTANSQPPTASRSAKTVPPPFSTRVMGPNGRRVYKESIRIVAEALKEAESIKPRRRVTAATNPYR